MPEEFFLIFSNHLVSKGPDNIRVIFNALTSEASPSENLPKGWNVYLGSLIAFLTSHGQKIIPEFKQTINTAYNANTSMVGVLESAFEAVFGHLDGYCSNMCRRRHGRELLLGEDFFHKSSLMTLS